MYAKILHFHRQRQHDAFKKWDEEMAAKTPRTALKELNPANLSGGGANGGNSRDVFNSDVTHDFEIRCLNR